MSTPVAQAVAQADIQAAQAAAQVPGGGQAVQAVGIAEAAQALRVSPDTIRRRIRKGDLRAKRVSTPQGYVWQVLLPVETVDSATPTTPMPPESAPRQESNSAPAEVRRLEEHVTDLRAQVSRLEEELTARRREVSELHTLLGMAQQRALLNVPVESKEGTHQHGEETNSAPPMQETPGQGAHPPSGTPAQMPWWQRIWRLGATA